MTAFVTFTERFRNARIVVIGDLMLDHYLMGRVSRISPEAPVPVVDVQEESYRPGGAANVAHGITALEGTATLCGVIGEDDDGRRLQAMLRAQGVGMDGVITDRDRPTTVKTRVVAHQQQIVRVDREVTDPLPAAVERQLFARAERLLPAAQCVILSDYAKGVFSEGLAKDLIQLARRHGLKVIADPKVANFDYMAGATVATPNHLEAMQIAAGRIAAGSDLRAVGRHLLDRLRGDAVLITRGEAGMSLFETGDRVTDIPTVAQQVFDVTGAGDTVAAVLALGLAAGASMVDAARLANAAAGVVVGIVGTATITVDELTRALRHQQETP